MNSVQSIVENDLPDVPHGYSLAAKHRKPGCAKLIDSAVTSHGAPATSENTGMMASGGGMDRGEGDS